MTLEELRKCKTESGLTTARLSELSGVPVGTINKIFSGETRSPRYDTMEALERVLAPRPQEAEFVQEEPAYGIGRNQGDYTVKEYRELPTDVRAELIDGWLVYLEAPSVIHQMVLSELTFVFQSYIKRKKGSCLLLTSPLDVQLDKDEKTMVQPDLTIICSRDKVTEQHIYGAPDFIVEIMSPGSRKLDAVKKVQKYCDAGVREYWIVDTKREVVLVYWFEEDAVPVIYGFQDKIPVGIYQGELEVDFSEIRYQLQQWR